MQKLIYLMALLVAPLLVNSQSCLNYQEGQKIYATSGSWLNMGTFDPKFAGMKEEKQNSIVDAHNKSVADGSLKSSGGGDFTFNIKSVSESGNQKVALLSTSFNNVEYKYLYACKNDTLFFSRSLGPVPTVLNGDTFGVTIMGIQAIPNNLKIGDVIPPYEDLTIVFPKVSKYQVAAKVFAGYRTSTTVENGFGYDQSSGKYVQGEWNVTRTSAVYDHVMVDVKETVNSNMHAINYFYAQVTREEELEIDGKKYKAFVIESENWSKVGVQFNYESENQQVANQLTKEMERATKAVIRTTSKKGFTNSLGYTVLYKTEWFVPGLGVIQAVTYDKYGSLVSKTVTTAIK